MRDFKETNAKPLVGLRDCPRLAAMMASARGSAEAPAPAWPARCGRCCQPGPGHDDLTEPWCEACIRTNWRDYAPIFRGWVYRNRRRYLESASVPPAFQLCGLDNFEARAKDQTRAIGAVVEWCAGGQHGLFLHGAVGAGKTHLATVALLEKLALKKRCRFVAVRELILECRESFRRDTLLSKIIDRLTYGPDFLLLDDLGAEKPTEFSREALELLIDRAYVEQRPRLIVTSNIDLDGLGRSISERIADRLRELCAVVRLGGGSYRRRIAARRGGTNVGRLP